MHKLSKLAAALLARRADLFPRGRSEGCRRRRGHREWSRHFRRASPMPSSASSRHREHRIAPELKNAVREELIRRELLVQEAKKLGLDKKPDVAAQADLARQALFIRAFVQDFVKKHPISDEQVKAAYDRMKSQMGNTEYKVRHILVEKEDDAKLIITNLKKGGEVRRIGQAVQGPRFA
jgi:hypothetical protein